MIRALKVALVVFGVIEVVLGILLAAFPDQAASMSGVDEVSGYLKYTMASLGICLLIPSVFLILAARDPLRYINWVRFAIVWCIVGAIVGLASVAQGDVEFSDVAMPIIVDAVFAVVFLVLYPYRTAKSG